MPQRDVVAVVVVAVVVVVAAVVVVVVAAVAVVVVVVSSCMFDSMKSQLAINQRDLKLRRPQLRQSKKM